VVGWVKGAQRPGVVDRIFCFFSHFCDKKITSRPLKDLIYDLDPILNVIGYGAKVTQLGAIGYGAKL
jgi:hypothetical protein